VITAPKLKTLQKLDGECSNADAALEAMAAGLEVIASDAVVHVGDHTVETRSRIHARSLASTLRP